MDRSSCSTSSQPPEPLRFTKQINESLFQLYKPAKVPSMQVLFFHGFQLGDDEEAHLVTWKSRDGSCIWPQTWLADEFPGAHILSVSYNARLKKSSRKGNVDFELIGENLMSDLLDAKIGQEPGSPVILVGHSFGGLVMKQLCLHARKRGSSKHKRFLRNVKGLFFYSTPHRGMVGMDERFGGMEAHFIGKSPLLEYVKILSTPSARLDHDFDNLRKKYDFWRIAAVGEILPTNLGLFRSTIIVPEASSRYGDFVLAEAADHVTVCKPEAKTSRSFNKLTTLLHDIKSEIDESGGNYQHLPNPLVGIDETLEEVQGKLLRVTSLGLVGMGGIGKTTLAMALFNVLRPRYDYTCFLKHVKTMEAFEASTVLEQMYYRGRKVLRIEDGLSLLRGKEVLIILDDVASEEQLEVVQILTRNILFMVHEDSRFVATSRDSHLLELFLDEVHHVPFLSPRASEDLFLNYAFPARELPGLLKIHAKEIVKKCDGLPLTLEVIGKSLHKKSEVIWKQALRALDKAEEILDYEERLWAKLQVSYNSLDKVEQCMFLDSGTVFYNQVLSNAKAAWSMTTKGYQDMRWQHLTDMSLVRAELLDLRNEPVVVMHEQLHSLAKKIARIPGPNRIRIWDSSEECWELLSKANYDADHLKDIAAFQIDGNQLQNAENCEDVENEPSSSLQFLQDCLPFSQETGFAGYGAYTEWFSQGSVAFEANNKVRILRSTLHKMGNLRYLRLRCLEIDQTDNESLPSTLVSLELDGMHFTSLPFKPTCHKDLVILVLRSSRLQTLPTSFGQLSSLQILDISFPELKSLPNSFGNLVQLEKLSLKHCKKIQYLPTTFGGLRQLRELEISEAENLRSLPPSLGSLSQLQSLILFCCSSLASLPESFGRLSRLQKFDMTGCDNIQSLPESFTELSSLEDLLIGPSKDICFTARLQSVNLPEPLGCLPMLQKFCKTFGGLIVVEDASVSSCESLLTLPDSINDLKTLKTLTIFSCNILQKLPESIGHLERLEHLSFEHCRSLSTLPDSVEFLSKLKTLHIVYCIALQKLPETIGNLVALEDLILLGCDSLMALPDSLGRLPKLSHLQISLCHALQTLPESIDNLVALKLLRLGPCRSLSTLPDSFGRLAQLEELVIQSCSALQELPETLGDMVALRKLSLIFCDSLSALPESFGRLPRLSSFDITGCELLHELPGSFFQLPELEKIDLKAACLKSIPSNMESLISLKILKLVWVLTQNIPTLPKRLGEMITERNYADRSWTFKVESGKFVLVDN